MATVRERRRTSKSKRKRLRWRLCLRGSKRIRKSKSKKKRLCRVATVHEMKEEKERQ